jgi:glycosyltransferase involved in cell wall biosynthesis
MMSVLREFVRECQSAGVANEFPHPLLVPEIFDAYRGTLEENVSRWFGAPFAQIFEDEANERWQTRLNARASQQMRPADRPLRILFITSGNWAFLLNLFRYLEAEETDIQFRTFDFSMNEEIIKKDHAHELYAPVRFGLDPESVWNRVHNMDGTFSELVEWADVVVCEWATAHAVWLSRFLPPHKRLVIRLHSYEAFTQWPFFMNFGGVDGLIFVADHIKRFSDLQFRWSRFPLRHQVLANFNFLEGFAGNKSPEARRTLGMVGYSNLNKDPLMAARILAKLRQSDPSWRLLLVGHPWNSATLKGKELDYFQQFQTFVAQNDLAASIVYRGFTRDIPEVMKDIGFILSCSWREGTHESILEGMASGAIPAVRKWPMVHQFGAPETVYPDLEYYDTAEEAAEIVLQYAEPASFDRRSAEAKKYALERFDIRAVYPEFKKLIEDFSQIP